MTAIDWKLVKRALPDGADNTTTCPGDLLDWYTDIVGEPPCMTYQKLRQLCDSSYQVPLFRQTTPGDQCDSEVSACCCNSVAWSLSMLCMNCQWHATANGTSSIDANAGDYFKYRFSNITTYSGYCGSGNNGTLPTEVQTAVCNSGVRIADWLYPLYWSDGSWFFTNFKDQVSLAQASSSNNTLTTCENYTSVATISSAPSPTTSSSGESNSVASTSFCFAASTGAGAVSHKSEVGAIAGGVVGGVLGFLALLGVVFLFFRQQRERAAKDFGAVNGTGADAVEGKGPGNTPPVAPMSAEPYTVAPPAPAGIPSHSSKRPLRPAPGRSVYGHGSSASGPLYTHTGSASDVTGGMGLLTAGSESTMLRQEGMHAPLEPEEDAGLVPANLRPPPDYRSSWGSTHGW